MTAAECLAPEQCPVPDVPGPVDARRLRVTMWPADRPFYRAYDVHYGCDEFSSGGYARFSPPRATLLTEVGPTDIVPTMYGGATESVALLETVFHGVSEKAVPRVVMLRDVRRRGVACLTAPRALRLIDLRDDRLHALGLERAQLITSSAAHYACTQQWASWLHQRRPGGSLPDGVLWHSRQAELAGDEPQEAFVLFGDRAPAAGAYRLVAHGVRNLVEGVGRSLVEELAERFDAYIEPD